MTEIKEKKERKPRNHGFEMPLHPTQILTFLLFFGDIATFFAIDILSIFHLKGLSILLTTLFILPCLSTLYYAYIVTHSNPTDPSIYFNCQEIQPDWDTYEFYCTICQSYVLQGSKHCGQCNRCTSGFDHHCIYLNNCIGEKNYNQFFRLIVSVFAMMAVHNFANLYVVHHINQENEDILANQLEFYKKQISKEFRITLIVISTLNFLSLFLIINLIVFHIRIQQQGLSTYQYLRLKNAKGESKTVIRVQIESEKSIRDELVKQQEKLRQEIKQKELDKINDHIQLMDLEVNNINLKSNSRKRVMPSSTKVYHKNQINKSEMKIEPENCNTSMQDEQESTINKDSVLQILKTNPDVVEDNRVGVRLKSIE